MTANRTGTGLAGSAGGRFGFPGCAHCLALSLLPGYVHGAEVRTTVFPLSESGAPMEALLGGQIDMLQLTCTCRW